MATSINHTPELLRQIGQRVAKHRLNQNVTQAELAHEAGISKRTLERLEAGESIQLVGFLKILSALKLAGSIDSVIPDVPPSPLEQLKLRGNVRQRASGSRVSEPESPPWEWGDDEP